MSSLSPFSVILVGNYIPDGQESMLRFATVLEKELRNRGVEARIIRPAVVLGRYKTGRAFLDKWIGYIDKYILFPLTLRRLAHEPGTVFHICDHSNAVYGKYLPGPWLVTCHDLLAVQSALGEFPENRPRLTGRMLQHWILSSLRRARHAACDSDHTADQIARLAGLPRERLQVIRLGQSAPFSPLPATDAKSAARQLFESRGLVPPARYLFHIGGNHWYKNRRGLIEIFSRVDKAAPDLQLVFAGSPLPADLKALITDKRLDAQVLDVGAVSHHELNALYSSAEAFVFPSLAEGFGWPVVEAHAAGCPVIATNRAPVNEITNGAAVLIDPLATDQTAQAIVDFLAWPPDQKTALIIKGLENARYFETGRMMDDYLQFYRQVWAEESGATAGRAAATA